MTTLRLLIEHLENYASNLGDDYEVKYYNPLTRGYEELELTVSQNFLDENDEVPSEECIIIHSSDEELGDIEEF